MDQKNTIVKCKAHPNCLFNHNGVCDNYVINISADGKCEGYVETENVYTSPSAQEILEYTIKLEQEKLRGQRAKCDFINDGVDQEIVDEVCKPFDIKPSATATLIGITTDNWVEMCNQIKYPSDWDYAATPDICKTCKKVVYGQPCKWKDVTYGIWSCYEEKKNEV